MERNMVAKQIDPGSADVRGSGTKQGESGRTDVATGLSSAEAAHRLASFGPNEVARRGRVSVWSSIGMQLRDPLIVVLLAACALTIATGDLTDAAVIALVVLVNSTVGVAQELRADRAVTALSELTAPAVRVRRDGHEMRVPTHDLVRGDLVVLGEGDVVPADAVVLDASALLVDESALTGESVPVGKRGPHGESLGELVAAGTVVVKGRSLVEVTDTGPSSALGRIAALLDTRQQATPLQRRLASLGRVLAVAAVSLSGLVLVLGLARGEPMELMVVTAISLSVAAVPESLPAVVTLSLALGARRMAARNAIVRRLPAVETLGSVTVIATDKTGTLTLGRMVVQEAWTPRRSVVLTGEGYEPRGDVLQDAGYLDPNGAPDVVELLEACALCNDASLVAPVREGDPWTGLGDPTEVALLAAAGKVGLARESVERVYPRIDEVPFDSATQRMTTVHRDGPRLRIVRKGSPESLVPPDGSPSDRRLLAEMTRRAAEFAERGYRVLAIASGPADASAAAAGWDADLSLRILGLLAMADAPKPAAAATIAACRSAGITTVMITGDHPATARAMAHAVGIVGEPDGQVVTGDQIRQGLVPDLTAPRVFARTTPEQKLDIIQAWRDRGDVVAMTGDGVNDGPALRRSDIGVAMGHRGTEVARQAADLVLADDELATVVAAVEEGRRVYGNIRRFLVFGLAGGAAEILVMLVGPFVGLAVPLLAAQILWINLLTHGVTGVALGAEPVDPGAMRRPPRPPEESVLGDGLWQRVLRMSLVIGIVALAVGRWGMESGKGWQSMVFVSLVSLQLGVAVGLRPKVWTLQNPFLPAAVAGSLLLALAGLYVPALRNVLGTVPLPAQDAAAAVAVGALGWLSIRVDRRLTVGRASGGEGTGAAPA
jgi:Ca2+-transporting ATPase